MFWSKGSDFLSIQNAKAQVKFYEGDLISSMKYLVYVKRFAGKNLRGYAKILRIAQQDVIDSQNNLIRAKLKLKEAESLE